MKSAGLPGDGRRQELVEGHGDPDARAVDDIADNIAHNNPFPDT